MKGAVVFGDAKSRQRIEPIVSLAEAPSATLIGAHCLIRIHSACVSTVTTAFAHRHIRRTNGFVTLQLSNVAAIFLQNERVGAIRRGLNHFVYGTVDLGRTLVLVDAMTAGIAFVARGAETTLAAHGWT